ncbi:hypothetical protein ACH3XW_9135 [Acanthocheilonema viteae]
MILKWLPLSSSDKADFIHSSIPSVSNATDENEYNESMNYSENDNSNEFFEDTDGMLKEIVGQFLKENN